MTTGLINCLPPPLSKFLDPPLNEKVMNSEDYTETLPTRCQQNFVHRDFSRPDGNFRQHGRYETTTMDGFRGPRNACAWFHRRVGHDRFTFRDPIQSSSICRWIQSMSKTGVSPRFLLISRFKLSIINMTVSEWRQLVVQRARPLLNLLLRQYCFI